MDKADAPAPAFVFVGLDGSIVELSEAQITAINTVLLQVEGPKAVLRPLAHWKEEKKEEGAESSAVAAVDAAGNLVAPSSQQLGQLTQTSTLRRAAASSEPLDSADPAKGYRLPAGDSLSVAWIDENGNLHQQCIMSDTSEVDPCDDEHEHGTECLSTIPTPDTSNHRAGEGINQ